MRSPNDLLCVLVALAASAWPVQGSSVLLRHNASGDIIDAHAGSHIQKIPVGNPRLSRLLVDDGPRGWHAHGVKKTVAPGQVKTAHIDGAGSPFPLIIVTGMEHTGTTITNMMLMNSPGALGAVETGFLLSSQPSEFRGVVPFSNWTSRPASRGWLGLNSTGCDELARQKTHLDMYEYAKRESPLLRNEGVTTYLDKCPGYHRQLADVMRRAPGVPVVVTTKTFENAWHSYESRGIDRAAFTKRWEHFKSELAAARREHGTSQIHVVSYEALFINTCKRKRASAARALFDVLGLPFDVSWFNYATGPEGANAMGGLRRKFGCTQPRTAQRRQAETFCCARIDAAVAHATALGDNSTGSCPD